MKTGRREALSGDSAGCTLSRSGLTVSSRVFAPDDRDDLEGRAGPACLQNPLLDQPQVFAFHQLKAA
jgi:hypothetical protein